MVDQGMRTAVCIGDPYRQATGIVIDEFDIAIQTGFLNQLVVFVILKAIALAIFILQLAQPLGAVVVESHHMACRIDALGQQAALVASVVGAALAGIAAADQTPECVIAKLLAAAIGQDDGRYASVNIGFVMGGVANGVGHAGQGTTRIVAETGLPARAIGMANQLGVPVPCVVRVAPACILNGMHQTLAVIMGAGGMAKRVSDGDQIALAIIFIAVLVTGGVDVEQG